MKYVSLIAENAMRKYRRSFHKLHRAKYVRRAGFWFVDIPRTSSSSIKAELGRKFGPAYGKENLIEREHASEQLFEDHTPAAVMRDLIGTKGWESLYTFTFVRNPFDRIQSLYYYRLKTGEIPNEWSFSEFVRRLVHADSGTPYFQYHGHRYGAADFILDTDGTVLVNEIFRYENRTDGIRELSEKLKLPELGSLHIQSASPKTQEYRDMYNDVTRELVTQRFESDLTLFGYDF